MLASGVYGQGQSFCPGAQLAQSFGGWISDYQGSFERSPATVT
jgi:hypothetical protein